VAGGTGRQHAVHHIHTLGHVVHDLLRSPHPHQVTRLGLWEVSNCGIHHLVGHGARLADTESADRVARELDLYRPLGRLPPQVGIHPALNDAEEGLRRTGVYNCSLVVISSSFLAVGSSLLARSADECLILSHTLEKSGTNTVTSSVILSGNGFPHRGSRRTSYSPEPRNIFFVLFEIVPGALQPPQCHLHRFARPPPIRRMLGTLIESHDDVCAQPDLCRNRTLRREHVRRPVQV